MSCSRFLLVVSLIALLTGCAAISSRTDKASAVVPQEFDVYASTAGPVLRQLIFHSEGATLTEKWSAPDANQVQLTVVPDQPLLVEDAAYAGVRVIRLAADGSAASTSGFVPGSSAALASQQRIYAVQPNTSSTADIVISAFQITPEGNLHDLGVSYAVPPGPVLHESWTPLGGLQLTRYVQARSVHVSSDGERLWLAVSDCGGTPYVPDDCRRGALSLLIDPATGQLSNPAYSVIPRLFGNDGNISTLSFVPGGAFVGVVDGQHDLIQAFSESAGKLTYTYCGEPPYPDVKTLNSTQSSPDGHNIYAAMNDGRIYKIVLDPASHCPELSDSIALSPDTQYPAHAVLSGEYLFVGHGRTLTVLQASESGFRVLRQTDLGSVVSSLAVRARP